MVLGLRIAKKPIREIAVVALLLVSSVRGNAQPKPTDDTAARVLDAVVEGVERSQGVNRKTEVVARKGEERHLAGSAAFDETIVGTCFDAALRPIAARLPGDLKSRDFDAQSIDVRYLVTADEKALHAEVFKLFKIDMATAEEHAYLLVSHQETSKVWKSLAARPVDEAPTDAAFCATQATEGRTVDVLFTSSKAATRAAAGADVIKYAGGFAAFAAAHDMTYEVRVRGYKSREAGLPNYKSLDEVLAAVTPGAPYIWDVLLVSTVDQTRSFKEKKVTEEKRLAVYDKTSTTHTMPKAGKYEIEVVSSAGVRLSFSDAKACPPQPENWKHSISCTLAAPGTMTITNPSAFGLGSTADVQLWVTSTSEQ